MKAETAQQERGKSLKTLVANAGWGILFGLFGYVVMFFFNILLARNYAPSAVGLFSLSRTVLNICFVLAALGITGGISRYVPFYEAQDRRGLLRGYLRFVFTVPLLAALLISALLILFAPTIVSFFGFPAEFILFLKVVALALPFRTINKVLGSVFFAKKRMLYAHISWDLVGQVALFTTLLVAVVLDAPVLVVVLGLLLSVILSFLVNLFFFRRKITFPETKKRVFRRKEWFAFSLPLFFTGFFAFLIGWTDNLVIAKLMQPSDLGVYALVFSFASFLGFFQTPFSRIFLPLISESKARKKLSNITFLFRQLSAWTFGLTFPLFLLVLFYARQLLELIYGPAYARGYLPLVILGAGYLGLTLLRAANDVLVMEKKTRFLFKVNLLVAVYNLLANILLIARFGLVGAALATSTSFLIRALILFFKARTTVRLTLDWRYIAKFIVAGLPAILLSSLLLRTPFPVIPRLLGAGAAYVILYFTFLILLRTFREEDVLVLSLIEHKSGLRLGFLKWLIAGRGR